MKQAYRLEGLGCANCAAKMERGIQGIDGVQSCKINFMTSKMTIEAADGEAERVTAEAEKIVKKYEPDVVLKKV